MNNEQNNETSLVKIHNYPIDQNPAVIYLASLAERSRVPQRNALNVIAGTLQPTTSFDQFPWFHLRYQHVQAIRNILAEKYSAASANRMLAALRGVLRECWRLGLMSIEDYQRAIDFKCVRGEKAQAAEKGRHLKQGEFMALVRVCDVHTLTGVRDMCMFATAYTCGLRRDELVSLTLADYNRDQGTIVVRSGKGNKERVIPVAAGTDDLLRDWVRIRGNWTGPLFPRIIKGDKLTNHKLSSQAFYLIIKERAELAGVVEFTPHDLRRTFAGDLLDAGTDISTVQKLMGHADTKTTAGYDRRDSRVKRDAVNRLHFPYRSARP